MSPNQWRAHNNKVKALPSRILSPYFVRSWLVCDLQVTFFKQWILHNIFRMLSTPSSAAGQDSAGVLTKLFWKGSGGTSQRASWRITGTFGSSGYSCAPSLFGPSTLCNALVFCICDLFCLNHKLVHAMGRKCRKTTSLAFSCVCCVCCWLAESHVATWEKLLKKISKLSLIFLSFPTA